MKNSIRIYFFILLGLIGIAACNDALVLDTELLASDAADIIFKDDFDVTSTTILEDSIIVYAPNTEYPKYPCGIFEDPFLGQTECSIYGQFRLIAPQIYPAFPVNAFDSVVLSLAYSNDGVYGNANEEYEIEIFRVTEDISRDSIYYSNQSFETETSKIGSTTFRPSPNDSVFMNIYRDGFEADSLYQRPPQERIKLNFNFGQELYELDSLSYTDSDLFINDLKGIQIRPKSINTGMMAFDLASIDTRLTLYYTDGAFTREFNFYFTEFSVKTLQIEQSRTGAPVDSFIDDEILGDSLVFMQGFSGPLVKLDFPNITDLGNVIINKAELEFFIADLDQVGDNYSPNEQLIVLEEVEENRVLVEDAAIAINTSSLDEFGGTVRQESGNVQKYTMNISGHVQRIIDGTAQSEMFIQPFPKPVDFARTIIYGANHSTYPIKLKLTYTQL